MQLKPLVLFALVGCTTEATEIVSDDLVDSVCVTKAVKIDHSLAVTDPTALASFSFARTMQQIRSSLPGGNGTVRQLYQSWMATYSSCANPAIDPQHYGIQCPRIEAALASIDPTDPNSPVRFVPTGVFNRFDLAPSNGQNCGEYRISYEMQQNAVVPGLAFLIFEGVVRNPHPERGLDGCRDIAQWWKDRSSDPDMATLGANLEKFYYAGNAVPGVGPVVAATNYGFGQNHTAYGPGQIRANMFVGFQQWNLREFKTSFQLDTGPIVTIDQVTVKDNPANELFTGSATFAPTFRTLFAAQVAPLAAADLNNVGMSLPDETNEYESVSSGANDVLYDVQANGAMRNAVTAQLSRLGIADLGVTDILRRASSQTCAGCHELSTKPGEDDMGRDQFWPITMPFTHIRGGAMSPALTRVFLPHRLSVLENFLCGTHTTVDDGLTVGGSRVGAAS